ncbi:MAG: TetR/AcrR family transcriptional regulator [Acidobacteriota bacterium]
MPKKPIHRDRPSRPLRTKAQQHRDALVRTAIRLFRRQGYARTGLNEVLRRSGAPKGSLYHYFPGGKEELGAEAVRVACGSVEQTLLGLEETCTSPAEFLRSYLQLLGGWMEASGFRDGCPVATTLLEMAPGVEPIAEAGRRGFEAWTDVMARALRSPGESDAARRAKARTVVAAVEGALLLARAEGSARPLRDVEATLLRLLD